MAVQEIAGSIVGLRAGAQSQETSVQQYLWIVHEMEDKMEEITGLRNKWQRLQKVWSNIR